MINVLGVLKCVLSVMKCVEINKINLLFSPSSIIIMKIIKIKNRIKDNTVYNMETSNNNILGISLTTEKLINHTLLINLLLKLLQQR